jgi:hypothetical protein
VFVQSELLHFRQGMVNPRSSLDWDRLLQLLVFNEEFLVVAGHQPATNASLPFVHTARRCYRLGSAITRSEVRVTASSECGTPGRSPTYRMA